jgi:hypothetical protein
MIIDFHTHIFPDKIAVKTVNHLEYIGRIKAYADGTLEDLKRSMKEAGVTHSVVLPIVTKPEQFRHINEFAQAITHEEPEEDGLSIISLGGIHPDSANYKEELRIIKRKGLKGIKLHPYYQATYIDDIKYERIIDYASQLGLIVSIHCGRDLGYPKEIYATPERLKRMLRDVFCGVSSEKLILAHLGGHDMLDQAEELLVGGNYYMDLAYILRLSRPEQILRMCRNHGIEKILFATDSPWSGQKEDLEYIKTMGFTEEELNLILYQNGARLLGLPLE